VPAEAQLMLLDDFIRAAWVECCDHLSAFQIGEFYYKSEPPSFDFSSIKILGPGETASMQVEGTTSEDAEDDEDYDKFDLEEEFDPMLLETIPADIVEKLRTIQSRDDASEYLREEMKVKVHAPDDKDRESIRQYFQRLDRQRSVKFLIEMIEDHSLYAELGKVLSVGQKFSYTYDFGSSTNLNLRIVVTIQEGQVKAGTTG
jgi:hypothetical protein